MQSELFLSGMQNSTVGRRDRQWFPKWLERFREYLLGRFGPDSADEMLAAAKHPSTEPASSSDAVPARVDQELLKSFSRTLKAG